MTHEEILETLRSVMKAAGPREVDWNAMGADSPVDALGLDSLALLDVLYDVQQAFGVDVDAAELAGARTVGDLVHYLHERAGP